MLDLSIVNKVAIVTVCYCTRSNTKKVHPPSRTPSRRWWSSHCPRASSWNAPRAAKPPPKRRPRFCPRPVVFRWRGNKLWWFMVVHVVPEICCEIMGKHVKSWYFLWFMAVFLCFFCGLSWWTVAAKWGGDQVRWSWDREIWETPQVLTHTVPENRCICRMHRNH